MSHTTSPTAERLKNGAMMLGSLWREGSTCRDGWARACTCEEATKFCQAKAQWLALAAQDPDGRELPKEDDGYYVILAMRASEMTASGITFEMEIETDEGKRLVRVGPRAQIPWADLLKLMDRPDTLTSVLKVMERFPQSRVM